MSCQAGTTLGGRRHGPRLARETVQISTSELDRAVAAAGLSHARVAYRLAVTDRTWFRWKAAGEIPLSVLPALQRLLPDLQVPDRYRDGVTPRLEAVEEQVAQLWQAVDRLARLVQVLQATPERAGGSRRGTGEMSG